jgi:hypothetical protein
MENIASSTSAGDTSYRMISIPGSASNSFAQYAGQTINLFVGMWTKAGSGSNSTSYSYYWLVDDISLK